MRGRFVVILALMIGWGATIQAQTEPAVTWLYTGTEIIGVTDDQVTETLPLPEAAQAIETVTGAPYFALTPDQSRLIFVDPYPILPNVLLPTLRIADLTAGTCCVDVTPPLDTSAEAVIVGPVSPDGTQVIAVFITGVYNVENAQQSRIVIADVTTGDVVSAYDPQEMLSTFNARFGDWTEDGIEIAGDCFICQSALNGVYLLLNPETGVADRADIYFTRQGDILPNGNVVVLNRDESRPTDNMETLIPPSNVVLYSAADSPNPDSVVYFDPDQLNLPAPVWGADGLAYLLYDTENGLATVVYRDGTVITATLSPNMLVSAGTSSGWLLQWPQTPDASCGLIALTPLRDDTTLNSDCVTRDGGQIQLTRPAVTLRAPLIGTEVLSQVTPVIAE